MYRIVRMRSDGKTNVPVIENGSEVLHGDQQTAHEDAYSRTLSKDDTYNYGFERLDDEKRKAELEQQ